MQTVGQLLRKERENKGLSIKDIEAAISIRSLYISAIEEDNYTVVPGEVYLKGFIRNYANYLGLDGQEVVNSYRESQLPPPTMNETISPETVTAPEKKLQSTGSRSTTTGSNKWMLISVVAVCVIGLTWWLFGTSKSPKEPPLNTQTQQSPVIPTQPQPSQPSISAQTKPVSVTATYIEKCWTSVTADDKTIYEGIPNPKDSITWEAQKNITITVGNAGGVEIVANGQAMGKLGGKGEVVKKTFLPK